MKFGLLPVDTGDNGGGSVCNCVTGTPHVDANGVCTCIPYAVGGGGVVPPKPTTIAPTGTHWEYNVTYNKWVIVHDVGSTPHFNALLGLGGSGIGGGTSGGGVQGLLQNKTVLYIALGVGALLLFSGKKR